MGVRSPPAPVFTVDILGRRLDLALGEFHGNQASGQHGANASALHCTRAATRSMRQPFRGSRAAMHWPFRPGRWRGGLRDQARAAGHLQVLLGQRAKRNCPSPAKQGRVAGGVGHVRPLPASPARGRGEIMAAAVVAEGSSRLNLRPSGYSAASAASCADSANARYPSAATSSQVSRYAPTPPIYGMNTCGLPGMLTPMYQEFASGIERLVRDLVAMRDPCVLGRLCRLDAVQPVRA